MRWEMAGEIPAAIPVLFTLLLAFLFLFLFTTRNFSLRQTFTPAAILLFSIYTAVVIGLWSFFVNQRISRAIPDRPAKTELLPTGTEAPEVSPSPPRFSDKIIPHNDTLPNPGRRFRPAGETTPIPDFNYRQEIVPRTIEERLRHFRQVLYFNQRRMAALEQEAKQNPESRLNDSKRKEFAFLQARHDRFLSPVVKNLTGSLKQRDLRNATKQKSYNRQLTAYLRERIETFLAEHKKMEYTPQDHTTVNGFIQEILNTPIDPNMSVTDRAAPIYSGPLLKAALERRFPRTSELILALLRKNADVNVKPTAMEDLGLPFFLQYTLPNGLENVDTCQGRNILLSIVRNPNLSPRELLPPLLFGADVLPVDEIGRTALHYAAMRGDALSVIPFLIYAGAEINAMDRDGFTPLMLAYFSNSPNAVRELEQYAPNRDIINRFGAKAEDYAVQRELIQAVIYNHPSEARQALEQGADPYQVLYMGLNLFQLACFHEALETVEVLLDCGVNPNVLPERETPMGRLPLYLALRKNNLRLFELLLQRNANFKEHVLCIHRQPYPLIHFAAELAAWLPFLKRLLEAGANVDSRSEGRLTPLMKTVCLPQNAEVIRVLLEHGADVNAQDAAGRTPLMFAALSGQATYLPILLDAGADPQIRTHSGKRAEDFAKTPEIRKLLQNASPAPRTGKVLRNQ